MFCLEKSKGKKFCGPGANLSAFHRNFPVIPSRKKLQRQQEEVSVFLFWLHFVQFLERQRITVWLDDLTTTRDYQERERRRRKKKKKKKASALEKVCRWLGKQPPPHFLQLKIADVSNKEGGANFRSTVPSIQGMSLCQTLDLSFLFLGNFSRTEA